MKFFVWAPLALSLFSTSVSADEVSLAGYDWVRPEVKFSLKLPAQGGTIESSDGSCEVHADQLHAGLQRVYLTQLIQDEDSQITRNELQTIYFDANGRILHQKLTGALSPCDDRDNQAAVKTENGVATLKISCRGSALRGEGSGKLSISVIQGRLTALKLENHHGWYQSFYQGKMDCKF